MLESGTLHRHRTVKYVRVSQKYKPRQTATENTNWFRAPAPPHDTIKQRKTPIYNRVRREALRAPSDFPELPQGIRQPRQQKAVSPRISLNQETNICRTDVCARARYGLTSAQGGRSTLTPKGRHRHRVFTRYNHIAPPYEYRICNSTAAGRHTTNSRFMMLRPRETYEPTGNKNGRLCK